MIWNRSGKLASVVVLLVLACSWLPAALVQPSAADKKVSYFFEVAELLGGFIPRVADRAEYPLNLCVAPDIPLTTGLTLASRGSPAGGNAGQIPQGPWQDRALPPFSSTMDGVYEDYEGLGYLIGGYGANGQVGIYDPDTDTWSLGASEPAPQIVFPVDACLGLNAGGEGVIVLFNDTASGATTLHRYNIAANTWDTPPVPAGFPANGLWSTDIVSLLRLGGRNVCYISGGATTPGGGNTSALYEYRPDTNTVANLGDFSYLAGGFDFHASWYVPWIGSDGAICAGGGVNSGNSVTNATQCYDLAAGVFNAPNADLGAMPEGVWGMADGVLYENDDYQLWITGGVDAGFQFWHNSAYYSRNDGAWQTGPVPPYGAYRFEGTTITAADGCSFYVAGPTDWWQHPLLHARNYSAECPPPLTPTAAFTATTPVCEGDPAWFYFTGDPGLPAADRYTWWFGDGISTTLSAPDPVTHTYATAGVYTVTLEVCNAQFGLCDSAEGMVQVGPLPLAGFTSAVEEFTVTFTDTSLYATSWLWTFGDGMTDTVQHPIHTYALEGTYTATQYAYNDCGTDMVTDSVPVGLAPTAAFTHNAPVCLGTVVSFTNRTTGTAPLIYRWAFGDGMTATVTHPVHLYGAAGTYTVTLDASNDWGASQAVDQVEVRPLPAAAFTYTMAGAVVTFTNRSQNATAYLWDFGDGITSTLSDPVHPYAAEGPYTVTLQATGACGTAEATAALVIAWCDPVQVLTVTTQMSRCSVVFTSELLGNRPFTYLWAFGDGVTSTLAMPTHAYSATGVYTGTLDVWNCTAGHATAGFTVSVDCRPTRYDLYLPLILKGDSMKR